MEVEEGGGLLAELMVVQKGTLLKGAAFCKECVLLFITVCVK